MGNRAIIRGKNQKMGVYVHWNGGCDSVKAFCDYCKLKGYRSPETDSYGVARLCQVIGNFFGGALSVGGIVLPETLTTKEIEEYWLDNGIYEIENWEIIEHRNPDHVTDVYDMNKVSEMMEEINKAMPLSEQLTEDYLRSELVEPSVLKPGDKVYMMIYDRLVELEVLGLTGKNKDIPYVDYYCVDGEFEKYTINRVIGPIRMKKR